MKPKEVINLIKNDDIQFIGCGITPLHIYGICASFNYLKDNFYVSKGVILSAPHSTTGRIIHYEDINLKEDEFYYYEVDSLFFEPINNNVWDRVHALNRIGNKKLGTEIYVAWTEINYRWINLIEKAFPERKVIYISIDDGGGSYVSRIKDLLQIRLYENQKSSLFKKSIFFIKTIIDGQYNLFLKKRLINNKQFINFNIFKLCENGNFKRNECAANYYVYEFQKMHKYDEHTMKKFCDCFLINTQCLVENNMVDGLIDLKLYSRVVNIIKDINGRVMLKPHPRELNVEKYKKLGCDIYINNTNSQEMILASLPRKPKCIISIFSSTLLNAYGLFNIPVISLAKLMLKENISSIFRKQLVDFIKQYEKIFIFPKSYEQLEKVIKEINYTIK